MSKFYKSTEWQSSSGRWYANCVDDLANVSGKWWVPARILNLSLTDYIFLLKDTFKATVVKYNKDTDVLIFYWDNYNDAHKYVLYINKEAKKFGQRF